MKAAKPISHIRHELETARAADAAMRDVSSSDRWVDEMRESNRREIESLRARLADAQSNLEVTVEGRHVLEHAIAVPFLTRVLDGFQSAYRSLMKTVSSESPGRAASTLSMIPASPGSFRIHLRTPPEQLEAFDDPPSEEAIRLIVGLFEAAEAGGLSAMATDWTARAEESAVRAMIRLSSTLAGSEATTTLRWSAISGNEVSVSVSADSARSIAESLAGETGREILTVTGHLQMAQDEPPRIRIQTQTDEFVAAVAGEELLDQVRAHLFRDVEATLVIDMSTSPRTGAPRTVTEVLSLREAPSS